VSATVARAQPHTLLVFDIDGTLVSGSRAGREAFALAIGDCLGITVDLSNLSLPGKTDQAIMQEIINEHGLPRDRLTWDALRAAFVQRLEAGLRASPGQPCPGVQTFLDAVVMLPHYALALGTGNIEHGARLKLGAHGLNRYFPTGGFGDDHILRDVLIGRGIERARAHYGVMFDRVVIVGDTPFDVDAARANGAYSLGVATGRFSVDALRAAGATLAAPDLTDAAAVLTAIESLAPSRPTL
jgi:phosphoglycolate phosphatase-like HAD superfamily hydrolase